MADAFWTAQRIRELERDLEAEKDTNEAAAWLLLRLNDPTSRDKAEHLTTLDNISGLSADTWEGEERPRHSRLIGWLQDWRREHGG